MTATASHSGSPAPSQNDSSNDSQGTTKSQSKRGSGSRPSHVTVNPWLIALTVSMATFMEVMDTSIANVALRYIAGGLAAGQSESTWVLTSYLVSNAIILPISGWLSSVMGRKRFYMTCVAVFTVSSFLCGIAPSLGMLLLFRVLQGIGGGGLAPSEQAILADTFEPSKRGQAFALYGVAIVVAPAIGPALGGWITDNFSWRWIFFINIPVGILSLFLTHLLVKDSPAAVEEHKEVWSKGKLRIDYIGFALVAVGLGSLQVVLDKGQEDDWLGSNFIRVFMVLAVIGIVGCVIWELTTDDPIVDLPLFGNISFLMICFLMALVYFILLGTTQLLPQLTQELFSYDATKAGLILMPGGFVVMSMMPLAGRLVNLVQPKYLIAFGFFVTGCAMSYDTNLSLNASFGTFALARCFQTAGIAFMFVPINTAAFVGIPKGKSNNASALLNLLRNLGGSFGVSVGSTMLARRVQLHQTNFVSNFYPTNPFYRSALARTTKALVAQNVPKGIAGTQAFSILTRQMLDAASMESYLDIFKAFSITAFICVGVALLLKNIRLGEKTEAHH